VALCRSCVKRFGGTYRLHLQGRWIRERGTSVSRWLQTAVIPNVIGHQACRFIGEIRMRLAASSAPVAVKHRAVNRSTKLKKTLCT
jgi:hypothetical protein